jgi:glycosyltransferase involved in cell wall biosynthesis
MAKKSEKISVITPSFNQGQYIKDTIQSVVSQDYPNWEFFINDAGSTDQSVGIIKTYARKYPRQIIWRSHPDRGQVAAINEGLAKASGDIIAYLNSDDYYLPGCFRQVADYFHRHPECLWLIGNCRVTDPKLGWTFFLKHLWPVDKFSWALPVFNTINQPAVFMRRSLVKQVGLFNSDYKYAFDYDYWLRCQKISLPHRLRSDLAVFRVHSGSLGSTGYQIQFSEDIRIVTSHFPGRIILYIHQLSSFFVTLVYRFIK